LNISGDLPFRFTKMGRFFDGNAEIDIAATSKDKKKVLIGECKYKNSPFDMDEFNALKGKSVNNDAERYYYLFSKSGFTKDLSELESEKVRLIPIQDLF